MKIVVDCRYLGKSGIGRFLEGVLSCLPKEHEFVFFGDKEIISKYSLKGEIIDTKKDAFSFKGLFDNTKKINKYDAFFTPNFIFPFGIKIPVYTIIHDTIFLDYKDATKNYIDYLIKKTLIKRAVKKSEKIFTVSNFTKKRIAAYFKKANKKVEVVYAGISKKVLNYKMDKVEKKNQIVFVGNLKKNKNIIELIKAFDIVKQNNKDMKLLIIGESCHKTKDDEVLKCLNQSSIEFKGKIRDEELFKIISESRFLIQPSLYEGFGLPPLEALYLNTRPIISNIEVFKEIYKGLDVIYYSGIDDLVNKILNSSYEGVKKPIDNEYCFECIVDKLVLGMGIKYEK